jgi:response regulator RpfG family c-di-GMP phosphodiesterase
MAVKVDRHITDLSRHEKLYIKSDFIDLLTHTCYILQVRRLPAQRRSRIEQFMTLFNQAWVAEKNYVLDLEEVPEDFKDIAQFLAHPLHDEEMQRRLEAEEELEAVFARQEAERERLIQMVAEERRMKEEERRMKEEERRMKEEERELKEIALTLARENAIKLARLLLQSGASEEEVFRETGLSEEEVRSLGGD